MNSSIVPCLIFIEGNIGCGKSTLIDYLLQKINKKVFEKNFIIHDEPMDLFTCLTITDPISNKNITINPLDMFYKNQISGFEFEVYVTACTFYTIMKNIKKDKINIFVRSPISAIQCFAKACIKGETIQENVQQSMLDIFNNIFLESIKPFQKYFVYLSLSSEDCLMRIKKRNRNEETTITLQYLQNLEKYYINLVDKITKDNNFNYYSIPAILSTPEIYKHLLSNVLEKVCPSIIDLPNLE